MEPGLSSNTYMPAVIQPPRALTSYRASVGNQTHALALVIALDHDTK